MDKKDLFEYVLRLGDDALILGQGLSEWCSRGPYLEEDIALTNVALDYIGRARMLLTYGGEVEGQSRDEDQLAFLRDCREFRNALIYELPKGDFAHALARLFLISAFDLLFFEKLCKSDDIQLAAIAGKAVKEARYHLRYSRGWILRLGDGTDESKARCQRAFDQLWGYTDELFVMDALESQLQQQGVAVDRGALKQPWCELVDSVLNQATLQRPTSEWQLQGGRQGAHTEHLGHMLAEMQFMQRAYPGLQW